MKEENGDNVAVAVRLYGPNTEYVINRERELQVFPYAFRYYFFFRKKVPSKNCTFQLKDIGLYNITFKLLKRCLKLKGICKTLLVLCFWDLNLLWKCFGQLSNQ